VHFLLVKLFECREVLQFVKVVALHTNVSAPVVVEDAENFDVSIIIDLVAGGLTSKVQGFTVELLEQVD